ncbi:MAG: Pr2TM family membrane protein [Spirochaetes bacterium]|nr:Pr2TM family membrane protein [Spirochaetota bacterium]
MKNRVPSDNENNDGSLISTNYDTFRQKIIRKAGTSINLFKIHSFSFISINAFLAFLNFITSPGYPWFLYPLGGMATILSLHYVSKNDRAVQKSDIEKNPVLTDRAFKLLKKIFRKRRFTKLNIMFSVSVSAFLFMVNIITGPGYLWAAIPAASLAFISGTQWFFNKHKKRELIQEFRLRSAEKGIPSFHALNVNNPLHTRDNHPIIAEVYSLQDSIFKQLKQIGMAEDPLIETIPELVENYISQIKTLLDKNEGLNRVLNLNPYKKLLKEKEEITGKMNNSIDDQLKSRYKTTLLELDKQMKVSMKIANQNEMLNLRINSALNSIRMLHLDLANLNVEKMSHNEVMKVLEKKSNDLSERLADLQSGYAELEKEML